MVIGIRRNEFRFRYDLLGITINYGTLDFTVPTLGDTPRGPYSLTAHGGEEAGSPLP